MWCACVGVRFFGFEAMKKLSSKRCEFHIDILASGAFLRRNLFLFLGFYDLISQSCQTEISEYVEHFILNFF
jgi:hypothetical protein